MQMVSVVRISQGAETNSWLHLAEASQANLVCILAIMYIGCKTK